MNNTITLTKSRSNPSPILLPQTSRVSTANSTLSSLSPISTSRNNHNNNGSRSSNNNNGNLTKPIEQQHELKSIDIKSKITQKSSTHFNFNNISSNNSLPSSSSSSNPIRPIETSTSLSSNLEKSQLQPIDSYLKSQNVSQTSSSTTSNTITIQAPQPLIPLVTPVIPLTSYKGRKPLIPVDDVADRQLAWLLNIEAKNRLAKQALETQSMREVICAYFLRPLLPLIYFLFL